MIVLFLKVVALDILFLILAHFGVWLFLPFPSTAYGVFCICDFFFYWLYPAPGLFLHTAFVLGSSKTGYA